MKQLFLYDFDGTITRKDTLFDFLKFTTSTRNYYTLFLLFAPLFILAKLGLKNKATVKERFISSFLKGKSKFELNAISEAYLRQILSKQIFRKAALASIIENQKIGSVYIVSASLDIWLNPISEHLDVGLICTNAHYVNGLFNGKFSSPNCNYDEKFRRVARELKLDNYEQIDYYGDSKGDFAMKKLATHFYYKKFR